MKSTSRSILALVIFFLFAGCSSTNKNTSTKAGQSTYLADREKHAPVGKTLYVLTGDSPAHCVRAHYDYIGGQKQLIVHSQSALPSNYCIYQKAFSEDAEGFSIFSSGGGVCKPTFTRIAKDRQNRKLASVEPVDSTVSMSYCVDRTFSYGEELAKRQ